VLIDNVEAAIDGIETLVDDIETVIDGDELIAEFRIRGLNLAAEFSV
jgi:hypothetical protein